MTTRATPLLPLVLLPFAVLAGCSAESGDRRLVTQVQSGDSAGIHRVHITDLHGVRLPEVRARRLWRAADPELFDVRDAWIEGDGSVLVANAGSAEILRLDDEGSLVARIGAEGEGPGEFAPHGLAWIDLGRDGRIAAYDDRQARVTWFSADGSVQESRRISPPDPFTSLQPLAWAGDGAVVATYGDVRNFRTLGLRRDTLPVLVVPVGAPDGDSGASPGASVDTLGVWPGAEWLVREVPRGRVRIRIPLGLDLLRDGAGPVAAVTPNEALDLRIYREGSLAAVVRGDARPRPVTEEDAASLRDSLASRAPEGLEDVWREAPVNEIYPDLNGLIVVQDGKILVGLQPDVGADTRELLILSERGIPVGRLGIPSNLEVLAATATHFVARSVDSLERESVELWRID